MATQHNLGYCIQCRGLMGRDYICKGCGSPIHWFCSLGDRDANAEKGHGAHYWCRRCWVEKVAQESSSAGCQENSISAAASSNTISVLAAAVPVARGSPDKLKHVVIRLGEASFHRNLSPVTQETGGETMPASEAASEAPNTTHLQRAKPASEAPNTTRLQRAKPASEAPNTTRLRRAKPASEAPNTTHLRRAKPASEAPNTTRLRRMKPASEAPNTTRLRRTKPASEAPNTTAVPSALSVRVSQWEEFLEQLNRPLTPSSCGQPASNPRTPVSHEETNGDDLYDTPLFALATAPSSVATTASDAFDVAATDGINLDNHFNGDDDGGSHVNDDTTLATVEEKEYAIALLKHHPFRNIVRKGKWKVVTQQQCDSHLQQMFEYVSKLVDLPHCFDGINRVFTSCICLKSIQEGTIEVICDVLGKNFLLFPLYFLFIEV